MSDEPREPETPDEPETLDEPETHDEPEALDEPGGSVSSEDSVESDWQRRRRLAAVFGDVLPETTGDERGEGDRGAGGNDEWLRRQVPPHHG